MIDPRVTVRLARPSNDLATAERFYVDGLGLSVLFRTTGDAPGEHVAGGDRADGAQVLGQHQVGAQVADGVGVEPVERLAAADAGADQPVDLGRFDGRRQRRPRHDPHRPRLGRIVAFVGDPDQMLGQP